MANSNTNPSKKPKRKPNTKRSKHDDILLPVAQETEQKLIALLLVDETAMPIAMAEGLTSDIFFIPSNARVIDALREIYVRGWAITPPTITDYLVNTHGMSQLDASSMVAQCLDTQNYMMIFGRQNASVIIPDMIAALRDVAYQRQTIRAAEDLQNLALDNASAEQIKSKLETIRDLPIKRDNLKNKRLVSGGIEFLVDSRGVWGTEDGETIHVCSPLYVEALTRDSRGDNWGRLIRLIDHDGMERVWVMPAGMLAGEGQAYRDQLLSMGVDIKAGPKVRHHLDVYLRASLTDKARCVERIGWYEDKFVFPDVTIGSQDTERVYLNALSGSNHLLQTQGTLEEWKSQISSYCVDNGRMLFVISSAFAAALLFPLAGESGGFHFYGFSSRGKSTLQLVAGSVWGGGAKKGFLKGWRASAAGIEGVAEYHNHCLLCLDEIAECDPREVGGMVYMLGNGQGKLRGMKAGGARKVSEWLCLVLSSGELTIEEHMRVAGQKSYTGQEVRLVNLPAEASCGLGVFENLHSFSSGKAFSQHLCDASSRLYGTPIRGFLEKITGGNLLHKLRVSWRAFKHKFITKIATPEMTGEVHRVLERFALVGFAGEVATKLGITGWPTGEAESAALELFREWLGVRGTAGSTVEIEAIRRVAAFIENHAQERFQRIRATEYRADGKAPEKWESSNQLLRNRVGFIKPDDEAYISHYHFLPQSFRDEVCAGLDYRQVLNALRAAGHLQAQEGRDQNLIRIPEKKTPVRVYTINASILD